MTDAVVGTIDESTRFNLLQQFPNHDNNSNDDDHRSVDDNTMLMRTISASTNDPEGDLVQLTLAMTTTGCYCDHFR